MDKKEKAQKLWELLKKQGLEIESLGTSVETGNFCVFIKPGVSHQNAPNSFGGNPVEYIFQKPFRPQTNLSS